jgi:hypothetical protein
MSYSRVRFAIAISFISGLVSISKADDSGPPGGGPRHFPPQSAYDVCVGKSQGDAVTDTITTPDGKKLTLTGTCQPAANGQLVLRPGDIFKCCG